MAITKIEVPELFDFGSDNSAFKLPTGTTAERPTSPSNGEMRFNTTTGYVEYYDTTDTQWWEIDYAPDPFVPSENFNTVLYTGNGGTQAITGTGFQPDLTWVKSRTNTLSHQLHDSVRGAGYGLLSNNTTAQVFYNTITSFDSNGFTVDANSYTGTNASGQDFVAWSWKAGGAARINTNGTITSQVSANTAAGFSIVSYTGTGSAASVGHGLDTPEFVVIKRLDGITFWQVWYTGAGINPASGINRLYLNDSKGNDNSTTNVYYPDATKINFNSGDHFFNGSSNTYIAYCFHSVAGYSKIGSYTGTGASSNTIVTGFKPAFVMIKQSSAARNWYIVDNKRNPSNPANKLLIPNLSSSEYAGAGNVYADLLSNGFEITSSAGDAVNQSGQTYIFMAFAADPT